MKSGLKIKSLDSKYDSRQIWKDDERLLCKNKICKFNVQYLGFVEVREPKNEIHHKKVMTHLLEKMKRTGELRISVYSVVMQDKASNAFILDQTLKKIIHCATYPIVPYSFFYVVEDPTSDVYLLYGFISCKEVSERIVNVIEYAMQLFNEREHDTKLSTRHQSEDNKSDTKFKQASLVEKFQDPQSSIVIHTTPVKCSKTLTHNLSIPRPKGTKSTERKSSMDNFPKLNKGDMFKSSDMSSKSVDSTIGNGLSINVQPTETINFEGYFNDISWCNFSSEEKLQRIHLINDAFHGKKSNVPKPDIMSTHNFVVPNYENGSTQTSRYDHLKNLNDRAAVGWSADFVKNPTPSKSYNAFLDELVIPNFANVNSQNTKSQSGASWQQ